MRLAEIKEEWAKDSIVDMTELAIESIKIPKLHSKYWNILLDEQRIEKILDFDFAKLKKVKYEYYQGKTSKQDLEKFGWSPFLLKLLKTELPLYLDSDEHLQEIKKEMYAVAQKIKFLESIIQSINNRGYAIKNAVDYIRFQSGG